MIMIVMTRLQNVRASKLMYKFSTWTDEVKESLFRGYCMRLYTAHLWSYYGKARLQR